MALQHLRSSTANKRPTPAAMSDGQIAINTEATSPGLFFKSASGSLVKVGPVHVGTTAPNASPASGGETGNTLGEQWLDTTGGTYVFKVWDGSAWRSETGTFVDVNGDTMTGALGIIAGSVSTPGLFFSGDTNTGIYSPGADQVAISTNGTERLRITSAGNVLVGRSYTGNEKIGVGGGTANYSSGTTANGIYDDTVVSSAQTNVYTSHSSYISTQAAAFTLGNLTHYKASQSTVGAGSAITSQYGFFADAALTGATNNFGFYSNIASGTGRFNFYANGTAANYFAGNVGIGTASPAAKFQINVQDGFRFDVGANAYSYMQFGSANTSETTAEIGFERTTGNIYIKRGATSSPTTALTVDNNSRVGIGTSPGGTLDIKAAASTAPLIVQGPSSELARIDSSGRLLVGTSTSFTALLGAGLQVHGTGALAYVNSGRWSDNTAFSEYIFSKSRGASVGTRAIVQSGDGLGGIQFTGDDGTNFVSAASITVAVDGTPGTNDMPGRLVFSTTADGASSPTERLRIDSNGFARYAGAIGRGAPVTKTGAFTVGITENWLICNGTASITVTLPTASAWTGREIMLKTIAAFTVVSASSNVVPLAGGAAGTAILAATAGRFATLVSDGTNWIIMQAN